MSGGVETNNAGGSSADPFFAEITAYVSGSLLAASAALEAYVNELFIDADCFFPEYRGGTSGELWDIWWSEIENKSTLEKYGLALDLKKQPRLSHDKASPLYPRYQSATILIEVRNALVHFKPQWDDEEKSHQQITKRLLKEKVGSSPFGSSSPLFPTGFMSHDMARWAVKTCWTFIEAFGQKAGVPNKYAYMVDDLNPGYPGWPPTIAPIVASVSRSQT